MPGVGKETGCSYRTDTRVSHRCVGASVTSSAPKPRSESVIPTT
ncbi:hypothetical protein I552_4921 [Mycobacterium xenopi 3993]|nr:hypothetical protein I552_4921 [Mycobacterium xenopi 3993]